MNPCLMAWSKMPNQGFELIGIAYPLIVYLENLITKLQSSLRARARMFYMSHFDSHSFGKT